MEWTIGRTFVRVEVFTSKPNILIIAPIDDKLMAAWKIAIQDEEAAPVTIDHLYYERGDEKKEKMALDGNWNSEDA